MGALGTSAHLSAVKAHCNQAIKHFECVVALFSPATHGQQGLPELGQDQQRCKENAYIKALGATLSGRNWYRMRSELPVAVRS